MTVAAKPTSERLLSESLPESLPPLTPNTVQRAREGWEAAVDREVRQATEEAFDITQEMGLGKPPRRADGRLRRWILRSLVRLLFRVKVENAHLLPEGPGVVGVQPPQPYRSAVDFRGVTGVSLLLRSRRRAIALQRSLETDDLTVGAGRYPSPSLVERGKSGDCWGEVGTGGFGGVGRENSARRSRREFDRNVASARSLGASGV